MKYTQRFPHHQFEFGIKSLRYFSCGLSNWFLICKTLAKKGKLYFNALKIWFWRVANFDFGVFGLSDLFSYVFHHHNHRHHRAFYMRIKPAAINKFKQIVFHKIVWFHVVKCKSTKLSVLCICLEIPCCSFEYYTKVPNK